MARALWRGALSFGLVTIPVEVHTAVRDLGPHFHLLRRSDKSPIGYQKVAKRDGEVVSKEDLVKGYEYSKGRYVVLEPADFEAAAVERNRRIDLLDFVNGDEVDDRYFSKPYYLLPGAGGESAYGVLREAMRDGGRIGIAKFVMRDKPHLAAVEVVKDALVLSTMRFRDELVPVSELEFPDVTVRKADLKMARQLMDAFAAEWDPDKYTNEYRANLMEIIEARRHRQKPDLERQEPEAGGHVIDLMERLRQSLEGTGGHTPAKRARKGGARRSSKASRTTARTRGRAATRRKGARSGRAAGGKRKTRRRAA